MGDFPVTLLDFFKANDFASADRIHVKPDIPAKILSNALTAYALEFDEVDVIAIVDNTMLRSGKDGCLICADRLVFRPAFSDAVHVAYDKIRKVQIEKRRVYVNGREAYKFELPEEKGLDRVFMLLAQWLQQNADTGVSQAEAAPAAPVVTATATTVTATAVAAPPASAASFAEAVKLLATRLRHDKIHCAPHIPEKKLSAALASYGSKIDAQDVLVLIDDTVFGGAKEGIVISKDKLALKALMDSPRLFHLPFVQSIAMKKRALLVNGNEIVQLTQLGQGELGEFFEEVTRLLALRADDASEASEAVPTTTQQQPVAADIDTAGSRNKLYGFVVDAIEENKAKIIPLLREKGVELSIAALKDDKNIIQLATVIHALLPGIVRLAVSQEVLSRFVLDNRDKLLAVMIEDGLIGRDPVQRLQNSGAAIDDNIQAALRILQQANVRCQQEFCEGDDGDIIFQLLFRHAELMMKRSILAAFPVADKVSDGVFLGATLTSLFYARSVSQMPQRMRVGMGEAYTMLAGLGYGYIESMKEVAAENGIDASNSDFEFMEVMMPFFLEIEMPEKSRIFVQDVLRKAGARTPSEFLVIMLTKMGATQSLCTDLLEQSDALFQRWIVDVFRVMENES